jgi:hypothetical protein
VQDQPPEEHDGDRQRAGRCYEFHTASADCSHISFIVKLVQLLEQVESCDARDVQDRFSTSDERGQTNPEPGGRT